MLYSIDFNYSCDSAACYYILKVENRFFRKKQNVIFSI